MTLQHVFLRWSTSRLVGALVAMILVLLPASVRAADPAFVGILALAVEDDTARLLGMSDDVRKELAQLVEQRENQAVSIALSIKDLPPQERTKRLAPFVAESERLGLALLTVQQRSKLDQIHVQRAGMASLADPSMAELLHLTDEQKQQVQQLVAQRARAMREGGDRERRIARDTYERKLRALLTDTQKASWDQMAGIGGGQAVPGVMASTPSAAEKTPAATTEQTPETKTDAASTESPGAAPATAQAKSEPVKLAPKTAAPEPKPTVTQSAHASGEPRKLRFNFRYQPWNDVLDWLAEQADLSLQSDLVPEGTFNYSDSHEYTPTEAIDLINGMLLTKGYTLVRRGRLLNVINTEDPIPDVLVEFVPVDKLDERGEFELIKTVFRLANMEPADAEAEIGQLLGPGRSMIVMPKSRQILVIETAVKLRMIRDIIERAENPAEGKNGQVTEIKLEHVTPEEVLQIARPLLGLEEDANSGEGISIAIDALGTRLFATGEPDQIGILEDVVTRVDQASSAQGSMAVMEQPQLQTHPVISADSEEVLAVLQTLLAGLPEVRLSLDPNTNKIVALAPPSVHKTIAATIQQMEGEAPVLEVIQLEGFDPQLAVLTIQKFFGGGEEDAASGIQVDADPTTMKLYVRATPTQLAEVKKLIEKLEGPAEGSSDGGKLRFIPMTGSTTLSAVEMAQRLWTGQNQIRLTTPSDGEPTLFNLREVAPRRTPDATKREHAPNREPPAPKAAPAKVSPAKAPAAASDRKSAAPTAAPRERTALRVHPAVSFRFVSRQRDQESDKKKETVKAEPLNSDTLSKIPTKPNPGKGADIRIEVTPNGILIASDDTEALDQFEELLRKVVGPQKMLSNRTFTVYFLKYCKAEVAQQLIDEILGGGDGGGGGSLLGDVASGLLGGGGGILGALMGGGGGGTDGVTIQGTGPISIVADPRLNCLVVQAIPADLQMVDELLKVIDREASITDVQTKGKPYIIPVQHMPAEEVANMVRETFADRIAQESSRSQGRSNPAELIRALRGGRGRGGSDQAKSEEPKMKITVDARSNSLVLIAPEQLYREVLSLVEKIDLAGLDQAPEVVVVSVKRSNPEAIQKVLASMLGETSTPSRTASSSSPGTPSPTGVRPPTSGRSPFSGMPPDIRARIMSRLQGGASGMGRPGGTPTRSLQRPSSSSSRGGRGSSGRSRRGR